jgi:hypothetical protein
MFRAFVAIIGLTFCAGALLAFDVRATLKKIDQDKGMAFFTAGEMDRGAAFAKDAKFLDAQGKPLIDGLKSADLKPGSIVTLSIDRVNDKPVITSLRLGKDGGDKPPVKKGGKKDVVYEEFKVDTSALVPLTDMGAKDYKGFKGGLYPDGKNTRPANHEAAGLALAKLVMPRDKAGKPADDGKIVLLGIGFSNTVQAFNGFMQVAQNDKEINPKVVLVNGAYGGMAAYMVHKPDEGRGKIYWASVDDKLKAANVTREQVQVVWIKETNPTTAQEGGFPKYTQDLQAQLGDIMRILHARFPNLNQVYVSSRTYAGWAKARAGTKGPGNSEPYSYETGFAVKWLIEHQLKGDADLNYDAAKGAVKAPWMSWGPYLWANGPAKRSDGFFFTKEDFKNDDQMHHSAAGITKMGEQLVRFFKTDATTRGWFVARK